MSAEMPARIWAERYHLGGLRRTAGWNHDTAYVRADIADGLLEALKALTAVCERQPRISKAMPEAGSPLALARAAIARATEAG